MAKNSVNDYSVTASNNTDIQSVDISEGCAPSGINNAIRALMADIADVVAGNIKPTVFRVTDGTGFEIVDGTTATKIARFDCNSLTTTRSFKFPDADTTLVGTDATQTLSNKTLASPTITGSLTLPSALAVADGGTGATTASTARTNLGLEIGTDVQAYDAALADLAGITFSQGDVLYHDGTNLVRLAKGTADQVLTMNTGATAPEWAAAVGGLAQVGSWDYSTAVSEVTFTGLTYNNIVIVITGLSGGTMEPRMQFSTDNGSTWISTGTYYDQAIPSSLAAYVSLNGGVTIGSGEDISGRISIGGFNNASLGAHCHVATVNDAAGAPDFTNSSAGRSTAAAYNAIRIFPSAGNFDAGSIRVYGV